jgi:hypothetical protein
VCRELIAENRDYWNMAEVPAQIGLTPPWPDPATLQRWRTEVICGFHHQDRVLSRPKSGNGAIVAEQSRTQIAAKGVTVNVHHIREATPKEPPATDPYVFSSPGAWASPSAACAAS